MPADTEHTSFHPDARALEQNQEPINSCVFLMAKSNETIGRFSAVKVSENENILIGSWPGYPTPTSIDAQRKTLKCRRRRRRRCRLAAPWRHSMLIGAIDCRNDPIGNDWQLDIVKPQTPSFSLNPPLLLPGDLKMKGGQSCRSLNCMHSLLYLHSLDDVVLLAHT